MGQGVSAGSVLGVMGCGILTGVNPPVTTYAAVLASLAGTGLTVDFLSDVFAKTGKVRIERDVIVNAHDVVKHVYSYYTTNDNYLLTRLLQQKHEFVVLESHSHKYYTIQKCPKSGDVSMDMRGSLRAACDCGLTAANRPTHTGEIRMQRMDHDFDVSNELQVAYCIAWLRKEDPRWAFSTENSKHFAMRLRFALNDF